MKIDRARLQSQLDQVGWSISYLEKMVGHPLSGDVPPAVKTEAWRLIKEAQFKVKEVKIHFKDAKIIRGK